MCITGIDICWKPPNSNDELLQYKSVFFDHKGLTPVQKGMLHDQWPEIPNRLTSVVRETNGQGQRVVCSSNTKPLEFNQNSSTREEGKNGAYQEAEASHGQDSEMHQTLSRVWHVRPSDWL